MKKAYALALFSVVCWASAPVIFKALVAGLDFKSAVFFFLLFGSASMFFYLAVTGSLRKITRIDRTNFGLILIMGVANYVHYLCYTYSLSSINASVVIALVKLSPIFQIVLASVWLHEKIRAKTWLIFVAGFVGAFIVATDGHLTIVPDFACFVVILAAFTWAVFLVAIRKSKMDEPLAVGWALLIGAGFMGLHLFFSEMLVLPRDMQWFCLIILGVVPTALAAVIWAKAMELAQGVAKIANLEYLVPIVGVFLCWLFLGEVLTVYLGIGMVVIMTTAYLNTRMNKGQ